MRGNGKKHLWALLIKFAAIGTVIFSIFSIFDTPISIQLFMIIALTLVAYVVGDLFILPKFGHMAPILGDLVLSFGLILLLSYLLVSRSNAMVLASIIATLAITAIEVLFHIYVKNHVLSNNSASFIPTIMSRDQFSTEFSEELRNRR